MIIATFNSTTGWVGKTINHDDGVFTLEGHSSITARDVLSYDQAGRIEWAYDGLRDWMRQLCQSPAESAKPADRVLFRGMSHEAGRNAMVTLYPNRIERVKERSRASLSKAHQDFEVTPMKSVTSVRAQKDGMRRTKVTVYASANAIDFRFEHAEAHAFKNAVMTLIAWDWLWALGHPPFFLPTIMPPCPSEAVETRGLYGPVWRQSSSAGTVEVD